MRAIVAISVICLMLIGIGGCSTWRMSGDQVLNDPYLVSDTSQSADPNSIQDHHPHRRHDEIEARHVTVAGAASDGLPVSNLLDDGLAYSDSVKAAQAASKASDYGVVTAYGQFLPSAEVEARRLKTRTVNRGFGLRNEQSFYKTELNMTASMPLYTGGQNYYGVKSARSGAAASANDVQVAIQGNELDVIDAALQLVRDSRSAQLQRQGIKRLQVLQQAVQGQLTAGIAAKGDLALVKGRISADETRLAGLLARLAATKIRYRERTGRNPDGPISVPVLTCAMPASINEAKTLAQSNDPNLAAAYARAESATYDARATVGAAGPQVDLVGTFSKEDPVNEAGRVDEDWSYGIRARMPLNFTSLPTIRQSFEVAKQSEFLAREIELTIDITVGSAWRSLEGARQQLVSTRQQRAELSIAVKGFLEQYKAGFASLTDLVNTERDRINADISHEVAKYDTAIAEFRLLSLSHGGVRNCTGEDRVQSTTVPASTPAPINFTPPKPAKTKKSPVLREAKRPNRRLPFGGNMHRDRRSSASKGRRRGGAERLNKVTLRGSHDPSQKKTEQPTLKPSSEFRRSLW